MLILRSYLLTMYLYLILAGLFFGAIGFIWGVFLAFRASVWWGLAFLFLPFGWVIFMLGRLHETKRPALLTLLGVVLLVIGAMQAPQIQKATAKSTTEHPAKQYALEQPPLHRQPEPQQQPTSVADPQTQLNDYIARAQRTCAELNEKRIKTNPDDKAAVAAFNAEVIQYNALLDQIKTLQAQVKTP